MRAETRWKRAARTPFAALLALAFPALLAHPLTAQRVTGVLVEADGTLPLEGAMVSLVSEGGGAVASTLTDVRGRFALEAPAPGRFHLRAERIGYESTVTEPFAVGPGETVERRVVARVDAVDLKGIDVEAGKRCVVRPAEGLATARVWNEARKALAAAAWTRDKGAYRYRLLHYERVLDRDARRVLEEERRYERGFSRNPFVSRPAEELIREGFVERASDGSFLYYAPDARVLLSDVFLDTHCVRLRRGEDEAAGLLGLAFEPVEDREVADIEGVVWLDPGTMRLRWIDFRYTELPFRVATEHLGGRIVYEALPNGTWIVREWRIRMPIVARRQDRFARPGQDLYLARVKEMGGEVVRVREGDGSVVLDAESGTVTGVVLDSTGTDPAEGATVRIRGTDLRAVTDGSGRYRIRGLGEGRYEAVVSHPSLDSLGHEPEPHAVEVAPGQVTGLRVSLPSRRDALEAACRDPERPPDAGILAGWVRTDPGNEPVPAALVEARWSGWSASGAVEAGPVRVEETRYRIGTETDREGFYRFCVVPTGRPVRLRAVASGRASDRVEVRIPSDRPVGIRVLRLREPAPGERLSLRPREGPR